MTERPGERIERMRLRVAVARCGRSPAGSNVPDDIAKLIESLSYGALLAEGDGRVVIANESAERGIGVPAGDDAHWYAHLEPSLDVASRLRRAASLDVPTAVFRPSEHGSSQVELHARCIRGEEQMLRFADMSM